MQNGIKITVPVVLASASPRRQELIRKVFDNVLVKVSSVDENVPDEVSAVKVPEVLAVRKALSVASAVADLPVIGCDTLVIADGRILSKPKDEKDALKTLRDLSGRSHLVVTGCAIAYRGRVHCFSETTTVEFYPLSESEIADYVQSKEPMDKAGAYGIQGAGGLFVKAIQGDFYNVVGLPVARLRREFLDFWRSQA